MKWSIEKFFLMIVLGFITLIFVLFLSIGLYQYSIERRGEKEAKERLAEKIEKAKTEFNLTLNKAEFDVKSTGYEGGYVFKSPPAIYGISKKGIKYKSKYFKELEEMYYNMGYEEDMDNGEFFVNKGGAFFLKVIGDFGLQPYILNTLIYDKSKGNDFEKIEQIFDKYGKEIHYVISDNIWLCGGIDKHKGNSYSLNYVKNMDCLNINNEGFIKNYNKKVIEKYDKKYEEYFSKPRDFNTIDWEEYMKIHEIHPIIKFIIYGKASKEEAEKLQKEIEPYYNKKILDIIIN